MIITTKDRPMTSFCKLNVYCRKTDMKGVTFTYRLLILVKLSTYTKLKVFEL